MIEFRWDCSWIANPHLWPSIVQELPKDLHSPSQPTELHAFYVSQSFVFIPSASSSSSLKPQPLWVWPHSFLANPHLRLSHHRFCYISIVLISFSFMEQIDKHQACSHFWSATHWDRICLDRVVQKMLNFIIFIQIFRCRFIPNVSWSKSIRFTHFPMEALCYIILSPRFLPFLREF